MISLITKSITCDSERGDDLFVFEDYLILMLLTITSHLLLVNFGQWVFKIPGMWPSMEKVWRSLVYIKSTNNYDALAKSAPSNKIEFFLLISTFINI